MHGDCKVTVKRMNSVEQRHIQNEKEMPCFPAFLVNSCAQVKVHAFQENQFEILLSNKLGV
jgi:hypothetical protein